MRKQTNPPNMSGRVRKLCVDKLVLDLALVAFSHTLVVLNVLTHNLNELPDRGLVRSGLGGRISTTHCYAPPE